MSSGSLVGPRVGEELADFGDARDHADQIEVGPPQELFIACWRCGLDVLGDPQLLESLSMRRAIAWLSRLTRSAAAGRRRRASRNGHADRSREQRRAECENCNDEWSDLHDRDPSARCSGALFPPAESIRRRMCLRIESIVTDCQKHCESRAKQA